MTFSWLNGFLKTAEGCHSKHRTSGSPAILNECAAIHRKTAPAALADTNFGTDTFKRTSCFSVDQGKRSGEKPELQGKVTGFH